MAGFLKFAVPFGEVGGRYLEQQGALQDLHRQRAAKDAALTGLIGRLGPDYEGLGLAIQAGVDPNTAIKIIQATQQTKQQESLLADLRAAGGKWNPDLAIRAVNAGLAKPEDMGKLIGGSTGAPDGDVAVQILGTLIANEKDPARKAELESMIPAAKKVGTIIFSRVGRLGAGVGKEKKPGAVYWRTETTPEGREIQVPFSRDATGALVQVPIAGAEGEEAAGLPGKLNPQQRKQIDSVNTVEQMIPRLRDAAHALPNVTPERLAAEYLKYRAHFGVLGAVDPRYDAYFNALGQIQTDLTQAAMGSSRAYQLVQDLKPHIPSPYDPPSRALDKLQGFTAGRFAALRRALLPGAPTSTVNPSTPPKPPFEYTEVRLAPNGSYLVKDKTGKSYQFDTVTGQWLPTR